MWDNIKDMAHDLNIGVKELIDLKYAKEIPGPDHYSTIITKSMESGRPLKREELDAYRVRDRQEPTDRKEAIAAFYEAMGGVKAICQNTNISANALYLAKSRGVFSMNSKYELMKLAEAKGYDLDEKLFSKG